MKKTKYILLMFVMMLVLSACGNKKEASEEKSVEITDEITEDTPEGSADTVPSESEPVRLFGVFDTQTLDGEAVTEEIFADADLTMVNIWGTFCGPCISEMPDLGEISREYADRGFQIVGLLSDVEEPGNETALEIVNETGADYTHLVASQDLIENVLQYVSAVPTTVFVDKDGNMVGEVYSGARDKNTWELIINQYLAEVK